MRRLLSSLCLALLLATGAGASAPGPDTPEGILGFAGSLLEAGETYRAATEYMRVLNHFGDDAAARQRALEGLGLAYARAGRWDDAVGIYGRLHAEFPSDASRLALGNALYRAGRNAEASRLLLVPEAGRKERVVGTLAWLKLEEGGQPPPEALAEIADAHREIPQKSPLVAGLLSAVLPGAGHLYVDRPRDAAATFVINGLFIWGLAESIHRENWGLVGLCGAAEAFWYSGAIVGSVNGAEKWNRREQEHFFGGWEAGATPALSLWTDGKSAAGLAVNFHW
jgi:tetratricopeptide (TPR) repeat protein